MLKTITRTGPYEARSKKISYITKNGLLSTNYWLGVIIKRLHKDTESACIPQWFKTAKTKEVTKPHKTT